MQSGSSPLPLFRGAFSCDFRMKTGNFGSLRDPGLSQVSTCNNPFSPFEKFALAALIEAAQRCQGNVRFQNDPFLPEDSQVFHVHNRFRTLFFYQTLYHNGGAFARGECRMNAIKLHPLS